MYELCVYIEWDFFSRFVHSFYWADWNNEGDALDLWNVWWHSIGFFNSLQIKLSLQSAIRTKQKPKLKSIWNETEWDVYQVWRSNWNDKNVWMQYKLYVAMKLLLEAINLVGKILFSFSFHFSFSFMKRIFTFYIKLKFFILSIDEQRVRHSKLWTVFSSFSNFEFPVIYVCIYYIYFVFAFFKFCTNCYRTLCEKFES